MKRIVILLVIILILGGVLAFKILKPEGGNTSSKKMSKEEIIQLLEKGTQYDNYILKYNDEETTKMVKGNIVTIETAKIYAWGDLDTGERIIIQHDTKTALIGKEETTTTLISLSNTLPIQEDIAKFVNNPEYTYKYLREETYRGNNCIVIQLKMDVDSGNSFIFTDVTTLNSITSNVWIDSSTGLVLKVESEGTNANGEKSNTVQEYDIELNTVKDNEVKRPNLDGYKVTDLNNM